MKGEIQDIKFMIAIALVAMLALSTMPHSDAQIAGIEINKPTYFDHKYKSDPYFCVYSSNSRDLKTAQIAISDWQKHLRNYTKNYNAWNIKIGINEQDRSQCTAEIMYSPYPITDKFDSSNNIWWNERVTASKVLGLTYAFWDRAWVYVFTSEYYFSGQTQMVEDSSGKLRPVPFTYTPLSDRQILSITEHEVGHVFGIPDDDNLTNGGVMTQGLENANTSHITDSEVAQVVQRYGNTGFIS